ncbi:MAG: hypothetical protein PF517_08290 [Salinivirgaceae bacterium]|jgi:hypothetical protein|nr:hypothetical protein [Salinivirgaceae bacterium]
MHKKLHFFIALSFLLIRVATINAQVLIADWDSKQPQNAYPWAGTLTQNFNNNDPSGINTSAKVLKYERAGNDAWSEAFAIEFANTKLALNPVMSVMAYLPATTKIKVILKDVNDQDVGSIEQEFTSAGSWVNLEFDFAGKILAEHNCKQILIFAGFGETNTETYYFDNINFVSGFSTQSDAIITLEKFNGYPTEWDSFSGYTSDVTSWTSVNGEFTNDSIRINRWPADMWDGSYTYPLPSKNSVIELGNNADYKKNDTLIFSGIDVSNFTDYRIIFTTGGMGNTSAPQVHVKADNGAWTLLSYTNNNIANDKMLQYEVATGVASASELAIKFTCENNYDAQWLDDVGLVGSAIPVSTINIMAAADSTFVLVGETLTFDYNTSPNKLQLSYKKKHFSMADSN